MSRPAIITCAVTGSIHTPSMSPYLPITVDEIVAEALAAVEAGAAIVHLHVRDPRDGRPSADPQLYSECIDRLRAESDVIINITTGGSSVMTLDERLAGPLQVRPEMASVNMGTMNFGLFPMAVKAREWKYEWEKPFLESSRHGMFKNTFADIERVLEMGANFGTRFEFECYDIGHLYSLAYYLDQGKVTAPLFVQSVFGILGGIGSDVENLHHMKLIADKLFGCDYEWSVLGAGRSQMDIAQAGLALGSNVRVGLEDSLWMGPGELARSNAEQVVRVKEIMTQRNIRAATVGEARVRLGIHQP
jgi:uncharacterized protein (DUF849 family)